MGFQRDDIRDELFTLWEEERQMRLVHAAGSETPASMWRDYLGEDSPMAFYDTLAENLPGLRLTLQHGAAELAVSASVRHDVRKQATEFAESALLFNLDDDFRYVHLDNFTVTDSKRHGAGTARQFLKNLMEVMENPDFDLAIISLHANNIGSYAWAKFGFVPDDDSWQKVRNNAQATFERDSLKFRTSAEERELLEKIIKSDNPQDIWLLADLASPMLSNRPNIESMKLGQRLLIGNPWEGNLERDNPLAMQRFNAYTHRGHEQSRTDKLGNEPGKEGHKI